MDHKPWAVKDPTNSNTKCQNEGCGLHAKNNPLISNCSYVWRNGAKADCKCFTATPTSSIPTAEIEELRSIEAWHEMKLREKTRDLYDQIEGLEADKERVDWLETWSPRIYFNAAGNWAIERPGEETETGATLTEAIDKARK